MPYIEVTTNVPATFDTTSLHVQLAEAMTLLPKVEKSWTMTNFSLGSDLQFDSSKTPAAMVSIYVYGSVLDADCQPVTQRITSILASAFSISSERIYIAYFPAQYWGCDGYNYH